MNCNDYVTTSNYQIIIRKIISCDKMTLFVINSPENNYQDLNLRQILDQKREMYPSSQIC